MDCASWFGKSDGLNKNSFKQVSELYTKQTQGAKLHMNNEKQAMGGAKTKKSN